MVGRDHDLIGCLVIGALKQDARHARRHVVRQKPVDGVAVDDDLLNHARSSGEVDPTLGATSNGVASHRDILDSLSRRKKLDAHGCGLGALHGVASHRDGLAPVEREHGLKAPISSERVARECGIRADGRSNRVLREVVALNHQPTKRVGVCARGAETSAHVVHRVPEPLDVTPLHNEVRVQPCLRRDSDALRGRREHGSGVADVSAQNLDVAGGVDADANQTICVVKHDRAVGEDHGVVD